MSWPIIPNFYISFYSYKFILFITYMLFFFLLSIFLSILILLPLLFLTVVGNIVDHISLLKLLKLLVYTFFLQATVSWIFIKLNLHIFFFLIKNFVSISINCYNYSFWSTFEIFSIFLSLCFLFFLLFTSYWMNYVFFHLYFF